MQGGEKAAGVKEKLVEMNTIQRLADARNCLEGKIVAVALSLLMALSFLNVSVFADAALAVEGFDGEVGEKTTEPTPPENDPEKTSESVSTPTNDGASETPGQKDDGSLDSSTSDGLQNYAAALTVDTDDVTVKLTAAGALPEGARLTVDVAENDEGKTAMEKALEEGYGLYRIYRLGLVDESGDPLTLSGIDYRVTVTWRGTFAGEMKAYRIDGPETVTEITLEKPLTTQGDINPNALTFSTELLNVPFAFAMPTSEKEGDEPSKPADPTNSEQPVIPGDENIGEGDSDNVENGNGSGKEGELPGADNGDTGIGTGADVDAPEQPAPSEPAANKPVDDSDNEHQLTLYVGEVRDLHRFAASGGTWASENPAVAEVATTGKVTAVAPGDAVVRCGEVTINVTVRPALTEDAEGPQLAYFYFLPPSENGLNGGAAVAAGSDMSGATFLGSGAVQLPSGYDGHSALLNGTVLPLSKDANGNEIRNKVVNLNELVVSGPSAREVGLGLAAYYNGSLDENRSKIKYSDITGYSYEVVRIDGKASCSDYDGNPLQPASAVRVYVQMHIQTADLFTVTYKVATPTGLLTHGVLHRTGDPAIALPGYNFEADDQTLITVDGATYQAKQHMSENGVTYYFDGWYEDGRYRQRAGASYDGHESATFYARYLSQEASEATFDANGGVFGDGAPTKTFQADEGGTYWLPEAPSRFGYEFLGWTNQSTGSLFAAGVGLVMGADSVAYTASWKASPSSIVLDAVGGSFGGGAQTITLEGETGALVDHAAASTPVRAGYKFVGWCTDADGSGPLLTALPDRFAGGTMTLYAQYVEDPDQYYTVTYRTYGMGVLSQRNSLASEGCEIVDRNLVGSHAEGLKGAVARSQLPEYYVFAGWFKVTQGEDGQAESWQLVSSNPELTPEVAAKYLNWADGKCADTVFEARFDYNHATSIDTVPYFVEYYVMDDDGAYPARPVRSYASILQNVREGSLYDIPERAIGKTTAGYDLSFLEPGKADATLGVEPIEGFKAQRYALDEERTTMQVTYEAGSPLTFKVYLQKRLGIRFEAGVHGELSLEGADDADLATPEAVEYHLLKGSGFPTCPGVTPHAGYKFTGWTVGDTPADSFFERPVETALTLVAQYEALPASIAFESNGGSAVETLAGVTDGAVNAALPTPVREGYTFAGWYDNKDFEGDALAVLPKAFPAGETTFYAKWTANRAAILFDRNASDATGSQTGVEGVTDSNVPGTFPEGTGYAREGYVFAGWNTKADGTGDVVAAFPATFAAGTTTYYAQWKLDVRGLDAAAFSFRGTYNGRERGIALPSALKMKDGETLTLLAADGSPIANSQRFAKDVADTAENLTVVICDAKGKELSRITGVSVVIEPATLTVTTSSLIYPFDGNTATSAGIAVTGLQNGETIGYRATGAASQVGDEVENGFELTWADGTNGYTAKEANYRVAADLGTIRVVSSACPVKVEGYVGVYDGAEHSISYEVAAEEAEKATISFDGPTAYTNAGNRTINYTVECADHGTLSGSIDMKILPRPVTIAVEDSYKIASTADPEFTGAIVEGHLVQPSDLGAISFVRTNDTEEVGFYPEVLTANYLRNTNYDVQVVPGTFTIGPAGSTVVPPRNPLLPPHSSLGAGMPAGATTPADAIAGVVTTMVGSQRAAAVAEQFGAVAGIILDEDVPMAASVSFDNEEPTVTRVGGEVIEDDATALGAFDEPHCWVHWVMLIGVLLTVGYAAVVVANRLGYARRIDDFNNSLTSTVATETEDTRAARVAHKA